MAKPPGALDGLSKTALKDAVRQKLSEQLAALDAVADDPGLRGWHYLPAARADLLRRLGRLPEAARAYREALALVTNAAETRSCESRYHGTPSSRTYLLTVPLSAKSVAATR